MTQETPKKHNINSSGFRIECYPNPNIKDKSFSKQYSYVPMHHIRPMMLFDDVLKSTPVGHWHPTIQHVMTAMGSVSCVARYKIIGDWPNFSMFCKGLYLGSEAIWAGEPLRLMPRGSEEAVTDVMIPEVFAVRVHDVEPEPDGSITGNRARKIHLLAVGPVFTIDKESSEGHVVEDVELHYTMRGYEPWYHKNGAGDKYETSFTCLLGRLYQYEAMQRWFPFLPPSEALNKGMESIRTCRSYATSHRTDHSGANLGWFWGEDRAASLDLATFNGIEVGEYDREREPKKWREILAVLDGLKDRLVEAPITPQVDADDNPAREFVDLDDSDDSGSDDTIDGLVRGESFAKQAVSKPHEHAAKRPRMA